MGFLANYMRVDDATLDSDDLVERIEELEEAGAPVYCMDNARLLHGQDVGHPALRPDGQVRQ